MGPLNLEMFSKCFANLKMFNLKCLEISVLVELQRICNNHEYHTIFTLITHLQKVNFLNIYFDNFKPNLSPVDDVMAKIY